MGSENFAGSDGFAGGITPDEEKKIRNDARAASFGAASGKRISLQDARDGKSWKSREQIEREIFEKSISEAIKKKEAESAARQQIEMAEAGRIAQIVERRDRPGARIQTTRSRGFLA